MNRNNPKIPYVPDIYSVQPSLTSWRNYPILVIRSGHRYNWFLGRQKAKVFLNHIDQIQHFVSTSGIEVCYHFGTDNHPVLQLENTETSYHNIRMVGLGLFKAGLILHWLPYIQKFVATDGKECIPDSVNSLSTS